MYINIYNIEYMYIQRSVELSLYMHLGEVCLARELEAQVGALIDHERRTLLVPTLREDAPHT